MNLKLIGLALLIRRFIQLASLRNSIT